MRIDDGKNKKTNNDDGNSVGECSDLAMTNPTSNQNIRSKSRRRKFMEERWNKERKNRWGKTKLMEFRIVKRKRERE